MNEIIDIEKKIQSLLKFVLNIKSDEDIEDSTLILGEQNINKVKYSRIQLRHYENILDGLNKITNQKLNGVIYCFYREPSVLEVAKYKKTNYYRISYYGNMYGEYHKNINKAIEIWNKDSIRKFRNDFKDRNEWKLKLYIIFLLLFLMIGIFCTDHYIITIILGLISLVYIPDNIRNSIEKESESLLERLKNVEYIACKTDDNNEDLKILNEKLYNVMNKIKNNFDSETLETIENIIKINKFIIDNIAYVSKNNSDYNEYIFTNITLYEYLDKFSSMKELISETDELNNVINALKEMVINSYTIINHKKSLIIKDDAILLLCKIKARNQNMKSSVDHINLMK